MKNYLTIVFILSIHSFPVLSETLWENPPVLCTEETFPQGLSCPDLTNVINPYTDFPDSITTEEIKDWKLNKLADLKLCRNKEVLRREEEKPKTYESGTIENAWMVVDGGTRVKEKLEAIESASRKYGIPPQILIGALKQESLLSTLGISPDGGNYSCGMAQLNIQEWCLSMNKLSEAERLNLGWPQINCDENSLPTDSVEAFYNIAVKKLGKRPSYQITADDFKGITQKQVSSIFKRSKNKKDRFLAVTSFIHNCQDIKLSVFAKAQTLKSLFDNFVPSSLKNAEIYTNSKTFSRICKNPYPSNAYPLHTGWLLAVAMYNAGPIQAKLIESYYQVNENNLPNMTPLDLIEALHWGGKLKSGSNMLKFKDQEGNTYTQGWFKSCIVQRHVAHVIQNVTIPSQSIAKSLETEGCKMEEVPEYRKNSSGIR